MNNALGEDKPDVPNLRLTVVPRCAIYWRKIGTALGLEEHIMDIINANHPNEIEDRCIEMLKEWLKGGSSPTWGTLINAIDYVMPLHPDGRECLKNRYTASWGNIDKDAWPPEPPAEIASIAMVHHHKHQPTREQMQRVAKAKRSGSVDEIGGAKISHGISDIVSSLENSSSQDSQTLLIEGAPGSGKTDLIKQMAHEWAQNKVLKNCDFLFLLALRDPKVYEMSSIGDLAKYFFDDANVFEKIIIKTNGRGIIFLFDGYDEFPAEKWKDSFIAGIIDHQILSLSSVVISSRPHATTNIRRNAHCHMEILGFTKDDQEAYFRNSLKYQPEKIDYLMTYLDEHPIISSLCYTQFNMKILSWLCKQGETLPNNSTELYNCIICHTIKRHFTRSNIPIPKPFNDLNSLPQQYKKIIQQLSVLCLSSLKNNTIEFSHEDLKLACSEIDTFPGAINGFGLLQAVEHYCHDPKSIGAITKTFHFIHFSIQEYLAAYRITCLPHFPQKKFIQDNFFSEPYFNTFTMYVGLTKGNSSSFKQFLSGRGIITYYFSRLSIAEKFFEDDRKPLRLFQCLYEADNQEQCDSISKTLHNKGGLNLCNKNKFLLPIEVQCLSEFLSKSSRKNWVILDLSCCRIGVAGVKMLHKSLISSDVIIEKITLWSNLLLSESSDAISEIVKSCKTELLDVSLNSLHDGLDLSSDSTLLELNMHHNDLSSKGASRLFSTLSGNKTRKLRKLNLRSNLITDEAASDIVSFLTTDTILKHLDIGENDISPEVMLNIVGCLTNNKTLIALVAYGYSDEVNRKMKVLEEGINLQRSKDQMLTISFPHQ